MALRFDMSEKACTFAASHVKTMKKLLTILALMMLTIGAGAQQRAIILTDMENEPDDNQSLVRLMLYTNEIDVRGIIATNSTHMRDRIAPETIFEVIDAYETCCSMRLTIPRPTTCDPS